VPPESPHPPGVSRLAEAGQLPLMRGLGRLLTAVESLPLRYAPFYDRLAALWDLSEAQVDATLARARDRDAFRSTGLPGVRRMRVDGGPRLKDASLELLCLAAGSRFPGHRHAGHEVVLVLEGSYRDAGAEVGPGDAQEMAPGSAHALAVSPDAPCVAAVVSRGFAFTSLPLRLLQLVASSRP